jgi:hypothetical protein
MKNVQTIYSLKELHKLLEKHVDLKRLILFLDLDLTLIQEDEENPECDKIIEPQITRDMFKFLHDNKVWYQFVTARFHDVICNQKKREACLDEIRKNIEDLYVVFEDMGIDCSYFRHNKCEEMEVIKNDKGRTIGAIFKGILLSDKKGELIKHFRLKYGLHNSHPHVIFVDDLPTYLRGVKKHIPHSLCLQRCIAEG